MRSLWAARSYKAVSGIFDFTPVCSKTGCLLLHEQQRRSFPVLDVFGLQSPLLGVTQSLPPLLFNCLQGSLHIRIIRY
jgi:hypothetical protein